MGMAASQARYLALVARKSNCEYEGQQINQSRLVLANQTANLFNQMLGLSVPVPPSTQDFTKKQYSFTDGVNTVTMDSWQQLATPEEDYNYVVTYHYKSDVYTGSQKKMNDPQVQFSSSVPSSTSAADIAAQIAAIQSAQKEITDATKDYEEKFAAYQTKLAEAAKLGTYADNTTGANVTKATLNEDKSYTVSTTQVDANGYLIYETEPDSGTIRFYKDGKFYIRTGDETTGYTYNEDEATDISKYTPLTNEKTYIPYGSDALSDADKQILSDAIESLKKNGALDAGFDVNSAYYDTVNKTIAFDSDLASLVGIGTGGKTILPLYYYEEPAGKSEEAAWKSISTMNAEINSAKSLSDTAKARLDLAEAAFDVMSVPDYVGNCQLTPLSELTTDQMAEISQIIKDMKDQDVNTALTKCFDTLDGTYDSDTYSGGIYSFKLNGVTYYTTYYDLLETAQSGEGINHIDNQDKLAYYNATYVSKNIEETKKALLETDSAGRFTSIRIEDDSVTFALSMETITDDAAYQDAMNQYYYKNAQYDKMVQDINAKTSLIHQEDQQLELRLKQLDTEQNALSQEMDAVQKVVKDNVEKSFKTFGG